MEFRFVSVNNSKRGPRAVFIYKPLNRKIRFTLTPGQLRMIEERVRKQCNFAEARQTLETTT